VPSSDAEDLEDRAVTLIRPQQDSGADLSAVAQAVVGGAKREVKTTLRSAADFGLPPPERRPEIQIQMGGGKSGTAKMLPQVELPPGAAPTELAPRDVSLVNAATPAVPARVLQTVRIHQPAGTGPDPLARDSSVHGAPGVAAPQPPGNGGTVPMPQQLSPSQLGMLPPTFNDLQHPADGDAPPAGLLSGKLGLVVGFLAGMVITAVVVVAYLLFAR
jgi:serine/threonine-protein kinase